MDSYLHRVVGLYTSWAGANEARNLLVSQGMAPTQIRTPSADPTGAGAHAESDSDDVLQDLLRDVSTLSKEALANGQAVLGVHARSRAETAQARHVVSQPIDPSTVQMSSERRAAIPAAH